MRVKSLQNDIREQAKQDWEERDESKQKDIWYKKASGPKNTNSDGLVCTWLRLLYLHRESQSLLPSWASLYSPEGDSTRSAARLHFYLTLI